MYRQEMAEFQAWADPFEIKKEKDSAVEAIWVKWLNRLFFRGHHFSKGERFTAAFLYFHPAYGKKGKKVAARL